MRRVSIVFFAIVALVSCLVGCSQESIGGNGNLLIDLESDVTRGLQAISMDTASYNVTVDDSSGNTVFTSSGKSQTTYNVSVPTGTYSIVVEALNSSGDVIGTGSASAEIKTGQTNTVNITVSELAGEGTFSIQISADAGYQLTYSIRNASGSEVVGGSLANSEGVYSTSETLTNGFYSFEIKRADTDKILKSDTLRVIKGKAVSYDATFQFLTDGTTVIVNEIFSTPSIVISLNSKALNGDSTLNASAIVTGITQYDCYWTIDGVSLGNAGEYSNLELALDGMDAGVHSVGLFVRSGSIIWAESTNFTILPDRPTEIEVNGEIDIWLIGDVLIPKGFEALVNIGNKSLSMNRVHSHQWYYCSSQTTIDCTLIRDDYSYYIVSEYDEKKCRTEVYIVIDKEISAPAYLKVEFPDEPILADTEFASFVFNGQKTILDESQSGNSQRQGFVTLTNNRSSRLIKVCPDTYWAGGSAYSIDDPSYEFARDDAQQTIASGETATFAIDIVKYSTFITVDLTEMNVDEAFSEKASGIALYVGNKCVGSWVSPFSFNYSEPETRGISEFGTDLLVRAEITLVNGISDDDFPYEIIPSIRTLTIEEGNTYSVKFTVKEKDNSHDTNYAITEYGVLSVVDRSLVTGDIVLPDTIDGIAVTSIPYGAFNGCSGLTGIVISDSVTSISSSAFQSCSELTSVYIPKSVTNIGTNPFKYCDKLTSISVDPENDRYVSVDGVLYNKDMTEIICYPADKAGRCFEVPESVVRIGESAFDSCRNLTEVVLTDSVNYIGVRAFEHCSNLASINLPDSLATIEYFAFIFCHSLTSIDIPASVTRIGDNPFQVHYSKKLNPFNVCTSLTSLTVDSDNGDFISVDNVLFDKAMTELICYSAGKTDTHYSIPNTVIDVGCYSFRNCYSLTSINIPSSVAFIGGYSLCWCDNLNDIYYSGTKDQWALVIKEEGWNYGVPATVVHCSDDDVEIETAD